MAGKYLDGDAVFPQCRRTYPGTAKDIEDLTLRINILESKLNEEFPMALACDRNRLDVIETGMAKDIGNLTLKVETLENADHYPSHRCETIETALKAQEDKFSAELSQLAKDTNRALCERKQINDTAREVSNEQAIAIYKMQEQVAGLEHLLDLALDRIAEIPPSGSIPPVEDNRLKCDCAKKRVK